MRTMVTIEKESEEAGPRTGKWKTYSRLKIPRVNITAPDNIMFTLVLKK